MKYITVEGEALEYLRQALQRHGRYGPVYRLRIAEDGGVKIKVNEGMWSAPLESGSKPGYVCPRCGHLIPNDDQPGAYPGALSRTDNETEICSACGKDEAMEQFVGGPGALLDKAQWPVRRPLPTYAPGRGAPPAGH